MHGVRYGFTGLFECVCMYRCLHMCGSQNFNHRYKSSEGILKLGFWDRTRTWICGSPIKLDPVVSQPQDPAVSLPTQHWDYRCMPKFLTFLCGSWKSNPGPHVYSANTLPIEPSPYSLIHSQFGVHDVESKGHRDFLEAIVTWREHGGKRKP